MGPQLTTLPFAELRTLKKPRMNPKGSATTVAMKKLARHAMHLGVRFLVEIAIGRLGIGLSDRLNSVPG
jgi:hypothetical protein